ncbi:MAG: ABC transporter ATP-binding protein [Phycisphaeraceae bacterium]|nr:ABC transporter ATP-binding protein [Phycisphaeraceae bacterium]
MSQEPVLQINNLAVSFPGGANGRRVQAADHISMSIYPAQTLAVVGESGSGKSVSALSVLQLIPHPPGRTDDGEILWTADPTKPHINLLGYSDKEMRKVRGNDIAMIFQEPMTSLNPVYTIGEQVLEAILLHQQVGKEGALAIAEKALRDVGIADPASRLSEYPHQLSGGMRQRVMIAMALACQPALLLADEPTTALDVTIQAQILELLRKLQHDKQMAIMLITHDLGVVAENADVVAVMYSGRIVEYANVYDIFNNPMHPYTKGLLKSMPVLGRRVDRLPTVMDGAVVENFPAGYSCAPHIDQQNPEGGYGGKDARLYEIAEKHWVLCTKDGGPPAQDPPAPKLDYIREDAAAGV